MIPITAVTFLAAYRLQLLAVIVALGALYLLLQRRRRHTAAPFTNVRLLASIAPRRPGWRRHVPAAAAALALAGLILGLARPVVDRRVPKHPAVVILTIDTSASMNATDVTPSRIEAAKAAAKTFVGG